MTDFGINEMQKMQRALQDKYSHKWEPICPEVGRNKLLWMVGEIGEVIDIVKKARRSQCRGKRRAAKRAGRGNGGCSYVLQ